MRHPNEVPFSTTEVACTEQLAQFFPGAFAVQIPVEVTALRGGSIKLREATVVEFGTAEHAIFISTLPLEFDDRVRVETAQKRSVTDAVVVAVQYLETRKAVAIKFSRGPCRWMTERG
ncbi:MAG TPA: hypothetical protein VOA64_18570 [Candidatus Dormibacteraeota bacterium]|nr:hypothetical protein [Candidatus Dormibacteraeota bacterium]